MSTTTTPATTAPPCPSWCTLEPGHEYEQSGDLGLARYHEHEFGRVEALGYITRRSASLHIDLGGYEEVILGQAPATTGPVLILDDDDGAMYELTAQAARTLATALLTGADQLDRLSTAAEGLAWWNGLSDAERRYWANRAGTGVIADAWALRQAEGQL